jgi:hypothetical protein
MLTKRKMLFINILTAILLLLFALPSFGQASDIKGHWAEKQIIALQGKGLIKGYANGTFRPTSIITRAEFIALVNRAFGFNNKLESKFTDISARDWFAADFAKAKGAGYFFGYDDGSAKPNKEISRQEAAVILCRILKLSTLKYQPTSDVFMDEVLYPQWSKDSIKVITGKGYMSGYPDNTFKPELSITRGEVAAVISKVIGTLYNTAGTYGFVTGIQTVKGNVTINTAGVTLQNIIVEGNLYLTEGIGEGRATLKKVVVNGTTTVSSGANGISIIDSKISSLIINSFWDNLSKVVAFGGTYIDKVDLLSPAKLEESGLTGAGFLDIFIETHAGTDIELNGNYNTVQIGSRGTRLRLLNGTITEMILDEESNDSKVTMTSTSRIKTLRLNAPVDFIGTGKIDQAYINGSGAHMQKLPEHIEVKSGMTLVIETPKKSSGSTVARPVNASTYPKAGSMEGTSAEILVLTNKDGKVYFVLLPSKSQSPSAEQVKAGLDGTGVSVAADCKGNIDLVAKEEGDIDIKSLTTGTSYDVYVVCEDTLHNLQSTANKISISTNPSVSDLAGVSSIGDSVKLTFGAPSWAFSIKVQQSANNGVTWSDSKHETLDSKSTSVTVTGLVPGVTYKFRLVLTSATMTGYSNVIEVTT